jgi:hypothetical protein
MNQREVLGEEIVTFKTAKLCSEFTRDVGRGRRKLTGSQFVCRCIDEISRPMDGMRLPQHGVAIDAARHSETGSYNLRRGRLVSGESIPSMQPTEQHLV